MQFKKLIASKAKLDLDISFFFIKSKHGFLFSINVYELFMVIYVDSLKSISYTVINLPAL